jgi:hypothetical protein
VAELEQQKNRLSTYQVQARFALATMYDRAANPEPEKKDQGAPQLQPGDIPAPQEQPEGGTPAPQQQPEGGSPAPQGASMGAQPGNDTQAPQQGAPGGDTPAPQQQPSGDTPPAPPGPKP